MPYENPEHFQVQGKDDKPFALVSQAAVELLEGILPAEKAQSVPYILIWQIDPSTGKAKNSPLSNGYSEFPLSLAYVEPPKFGAQVGAEFRFRERPPVSLERISIKSQNPRGLIMYRLVELNFTVHRPDVVFGEPAVDGHDAWSSLVNLGTVHALEYGWSSSQGVKNGILNGEGFSDPNKDVAITGRQQVRFVVTSYTFTIQPDNQIKFVIKGFEDGEFNLRQAEIAKNPATDAQKKESGKIKIKEKTDPNSYDGKPIKDLIKKLQDDVAGNATNDRKKGGKVVFFGKLFDVVFAKKIEEAYKELGYELEGIFMGRFNGRCGTPAPKYGSTSMKDAPISDFTFPLDDIEKHFRELIKAGAQLTLHNFINSFLRLFEQQHVWDRKDGKNDKDTTVPQIHMRSIQRRDRGGKLKVSFHIFDATREFTKFTKDDSQKLPKENQTRANIKKIVQDKGIPFVSLVRANSFVKDCNFDTVMDEQQAGILMRRALTESSTRQAKVENADLASKENRLVGAVQLFSPVINGNITMIGNFVFDVFALIWIEFGVRQWDGPFNIAEKEDLITRGDFTTTLKLYSAGTDPLGTKASKK